MTNCESTCIACLFRAVRSAFFQPCFVCPVTPAPARLPTLLSRHPIAADKSNSFRALLRGVCVMRPATKPNGSSSHRTASHALAGEARNEQRHLSISRNRRTLQSFFFMAPLECEANQKVAHRNKMFNEKPTAPHSSLLCSTAPSSAPLFNRTTSAVMCAAAGFFLPWRIDIRLQLATITRCLNCRTLVNKPTQQSRNRAGAEQNRGEGN